MRIKSDLVEQKLTDFCAINFNFIQMPICTGFFSISLQYRCFHTVFLPFSSLSLSLELNPIILDCFFRFDFGFCLLPSFIRLSVQIIHIHINWLKRKRNEIVSNTQSHARTNQRDVTEVKTNVSHYYYY